MKMREVTEDIGGNKYRYLKPNICPHCGVTINANVVIYSHTKIFLAVFICTDADCKKTFYATYYAGDSTSGIRNLVYNNMYPLPTFGSITPRLKLLSPCFDKRAREAFYAENEGFFELAACGYRNAVEALIKDYAVKYCGCDLPQKELLKLNIDQCIKKYLPDLDSTVSAYFAKEVANKATHYPPIEGEEFSFDAFKAYFELFINALDSRLRILELSQELPSRHAQKFDLQNQSNALPVSKDQQPC